MGYQGAVWFMFSVGQAKVWPQQKLKHDQNCCPSGIVWIATKPKSLKHG
jgi:hypothetical protein